MVSSILRRGGAWRFVALGLLAAGIFSFGLTARPTTTAAHEGTGLCSTVSTPTAAFMYMWDDYLFYPGAHYHRWNTIGGVYDQFCYLIY